LETIDVVVPTKDSSATLGIVLEGIRRAIPVNKLIIVDGGSSDATLKIAKKYGAKIVQEKGRLGRARYRGALEVETEWFCFIDSDILVYPDWYEKLKRWTYHPKVVWINGLPIEQSNMLKSYARAKFLRHRREMKSVQVALSNSLLKRDVVLECTHWLREDIHAGEDLVLYNFVMSKGYQRVGPNLVVCLHLPDCFLHDIYACYRGGYSMRLVHKRIHLKYVGFPFYLLLNASYGFIDTMDPRLFAYCFGMQGGAFLIKYLGIAGRSMDQFMERTEAASKIRGANLFLSSVGRRLPTHN
jgi:glycosyltransferase involved in cell wall biosynthesis